MTSTETRRRWTVEGPVPGTPTLLLGNFDLAAHGYALEEFFLEGTARSYADGVGGVEVADEASYRTRIVAVRPRDLAAFSGTVVVEWLNVSGGLDGSPDWAFMHRQIMRSGAAYVAMSAQRVGIEGGGGFLGADGSGLKQTAPERYGSLDHPGDAFSFDIYSQAGEVVREHGPVLGGATPVTVIAVGESQSAMYLTSYVNKIDALARVYDAFLVHGRGSRGAALEGGMGLPTDADASPADAADAMAMFRRAGADPIPEARVPTITVQSETDVVGAYGFGARCPDSEHTRLWEIAGAAHFDSWGMIAAHDDDGTLPVERLAELGGPTDQPLGLQAEEPINSGPQQHYVLLCALAHLERWAREGAAAPHAPLLTTTGDGDTLALERDECGNALGGLRTPWVDVPTAVLTGIGASGGGFTMLFGVTRPFDATQLADLYPGGVDDYLAKFSASAEAARDAGHLLDVDLPEIIGVARASWPA